jgi:DNA-binding NtrC family response regulator
VVSISDDPSMKPVVRLMFKSAVCHANVLLVGESGVGKTYLAGRIHEGSAAASGAFRILFCAPDAVDGTATDTLMGTLLSLEHEGGTIYLKNIDVLGAIGQRKLLGYLDARECRMKASRLSSTGFARLIFSSERDLRSEAAAGRYLRQLYLRASVITITVPPLRQREADIVSLARYFVSLYSDQERKGLKGLSDDAESMLTRISWEGNIHELKNTMNRAVVFAEDGQVLSAGHLEGVLQQAG